MTDTTRPCPACDARGGPVVGAMPATFQHVPLSRETFSLAECPRCCTAYIAEMPTPADFRTIYEGSPRQFKGPEHSDDRAAEIVSYYRNCLDRLAPAADSILEIGAGKAWVSRAAKEKRATIRTVAQDLTPEVSRECPWVDRYVVGTMDDRRIDMLAPFDFISFTHVIEHLPDPVAALQRAQRLLSREGRILLTAPAQPKGWREDRDLAAWQRWHLTHTPAHLQYFTQAAVDALARRTELRVESYVAHDGGDAFEACLGRTAYSIAAQA
jgi:SAM-dependent methyltransferase